VVFAAQPPVDLSSFWGKPWLAAEILAAVLGVASVRLLSRGDGRGWPVGVAMVIVSGIVYWLENIKGQALLNVYFLVAQLIGWRRWARGDEPDLRRSARRLSPLPAALLGLSWMAATAVTAGLLRLGESRHVELDAFASIGSLLAQALIVAGYAETWLVYLLVDMVLVVLSVKAELWFYVAMYLVYCVLAWQGWRAWTREVREEKRIDAPGKK
jgi:nicotinamide mononucleotide transporter